jgi:hypothetical protein
MEDDEKICWSRGAQGQDSFLPPSGLHGKEMIVNLINEEVELPKPIVNLNLLHSYI